MGLEEAQYLTSLGLSAIDLGGVSSISTDVLRFYVKIRHQTLIWELQSYRKLGQIQLSANLQMQILR